MRARPSNARAVRGALLPLLALALAGGGALWMAAVPSVGSGGVAHGENLRARARLLDARRALVAYASAYPDAYGPLGAGPGHLVCPDTDMPLDARPAAPAARRGIGFGGDGPNPPCGGGSLAVGHLPRHVSPDGRRRAFHHEPLQRFVYAVATGYVNNPPGRAVGTALEGTSRAFERVAVVIDPGGVALRAERLADARDPEELLRLVRAAVARESGGRAARSLPHAFVTRAELIDAAERRAVAWFVDTATAVARRRGSTRSGGAVRGDGARWPDTDCPDEGGPLEPFLWIDDGGDGEDDVCARASTIERVARDRHWFVRDGWVGRLLVRRDARCSGDVAPSCRLRAVRDVAPVDRERRAPVPLVIELAPPTGSVVTGSVVTGSIVTGSIGADSIGAEASSVTGP